MHANTVFIINTTAIDWL